MTRRSGQHAERARGWVALLALALSSLTGSLRASDMTYTNWPPEPEWVALTNHIYWCYRQLQSRCEMAGLEPSEVPVPTYTDPVSDYRTLAATIDDLADRFVDFTCATGGSFDLWFDVPASIEEVEPSMLVTNYHTAFPVFAVSNLHFAVGFTNWADAYPLSSWCTWTNKALMDQVACSITTLVWTAEDLEWLNPLTRQGSGSTTNAAGFGDSMALAEQAFSQSSPAAGGCPFADYVLMVNTQGEWGTYHDVTIGRGSASYVISKPTNAVVNADVYFAVSGFPLSSEWTEWNAGDDGVLLAARLRLQRSVAVGLGSTGMTDQVGSVDTPPPPPSAETNEASSGYAVSTAPAVLLRWQIDRSLPTNYYASAAYRAEDAWMQDTDRDDLVDPGLEIDAVGPDTGRIEWVPDQAAPYVAIPLSSPGALLHGIPIHRYLTTVPVLPYQTQTVSEQDVDGPCTAISDNTRLLEVGIVSNEEDMARFGTSVPIKQISLVRPRGQLVVFDFPWTTNGSETGFSSIGIPTGIHSSRSYALCAEDDGSYILKFDSGVMHVFAAPVGFCVSSVSNCFGSSGVMEEERYAISPIVWSNDRPCELVYTSRYSAASPISVSIQWDQQQCNVIGLLKTGLVGVARSGAQVSGQSITYGNGVVVARTTNSVAGGGVVVELASTLPDQGGVSVSRTTLNTEGRPVRVEVETEAGPATTEYEYSNESGRYANGLLKKCQIANIHYPEGNWRTFEYDSTSGWMTSETVPSAWGDEVHEFAYEVNDPTIDSGAMEGNWIERPRTVERRVGDDVVGRTLYAFQGADHTEVRRCLSPSGGWNAASNLLNSFRLYVPEFGDEFSWCAWVAETRLPSRTNYLCCAGDYWESIEGPYTRTWRASPFFPLSSGNMIDPYLLRNNDVVGWSFSSGSAVDFFGVPLNSTNHDGTSTSVQSWEMFGPTSVKEVDGDISTRSFDRMGRLIGYECAGLSQTFTYDVLDRRTGRRMARNNDSIEELWSWDAVGRMTSHSNELGRTTYQHALNGTVETTTETPPNGKIVVTKRHLDGTLLEVSGDGAPMRIARKAEIIGGLRCITEHVGAENSPRWIRYKYDLAGRLVGIQRNEIEGETSISYDSCGRPFKITDAAGKTRLAEYNEADEIVRMGLNLSGSADELEPDGQDRIHTQSRSGLSTSTGAFPTKGSDVEQTLFSATRSADARGVSGTVAGHPFGAGRTQFAADGVYSVVLTNTDNSVWTLDYVKWQLVSVERHRGTAVANVSCTRNDLGEITDVTMTRGQEPRTWEFERDGAKRVTRIKVPGYSGAIDIGYRAGTDWVTSWSEPDGTTTELDYHDNGLPQRQSGGGETIEWTYTDAAEMEEQKTSPAQGLPVVTKIVRNSSTGFPEKKEIGGSVVEEYDVLANGDLEKVTTALGVMTVNRSPEGEVLNIAISDGMTTPRGLEFDRLGRVIGDGYANGYSNSYCYTLDGRVATNTVLGGGAISNHEWRFTYDASHGELETATLARNGSTRAITFGYDDEPKVIAVTDAGTVAAVYGWEEAVPGIKAAAVAVNGVTNPVLLSKQWNIQRGVVTAVTYQAGANVLASFAYSSPTNVARVSRMTLSDGSYWEYGYDGMRRLTNAVRKTTTGAPIPGFSFRYGFDGVGNSVAAGPATPTGALWNFEAAGSQFHVRRVWSNLVEIVGEAATDAVVSVRTDAGIVRAERNGLWFAARVPVSNQNSAIFCPITVAAVRNDGTNDLVQETVGRLHVPKLDEAVTNGVAGVILDDSRWTYTWDMQRRLRGIESRGRTPELKLEFTYDPEGRRIRKQVWEWSGSAWVAVRSHHFNYLGWRPVEEVIATPTNEIVRQYVWGLDLSSTPEGAGGIGGLVAIRQGETVLLPLCDAMGNVRHLVDSQGAIVASYDYDPFGRLIARSGASADACPLLFSTKYLDDETGLYYFGYRYYDPCALKWLCRDPLGEAAGPNLTAFCRNDPVNNVDPLGLCDRCGDPSATCMWAGDTSLLGLLKQWGWNVQGRIEANRIAVYEAAEKGDISGTDAFVYRNIQDWGINPIPALLSAGVLNTVDRIENPAKFLADPMGTRQLGQGVLVFLDQNRRSIVTGITDPSTENTTEALLSLERFALIAASANQVSKGVISSRAAPGPSSRPPPLIASAGQPVQLEFTELVAHAERQTLARSFYEATGWSSADIASHLRAIDFSKPVRIVVLPKGTEVLQYRLVGRDVGNYFAPVGSLQGSRLGIYTGGSRVLETYMAVDDIQVLQSTASAMVDGWTVPGVYIQTTGGGVQFFSIGPSMFRLVK